MCVYGFCALVHVSIVLFLWLYYAVFIILQLPAFVIFLDPEGGSQKATLVVLVLVVLGISSLKIPKAFLILSGARQNFAYAFLLTFPTDLPSQIFKLISN